MTSRADLADRFVDPDAPECELIMQCRDHLANERTFLGWLRTSLSISMSEAWSARLLLIDSIGSLGIAITQLCGLSSTEGRQATHMQCTDSVYHPEQYPAVLSQAEKLYPLQISYDGKTSALYRFTKL